MLGMLYLMVAVFWGYVVTKRLFPKLAWMTKEDYQGRKLNVSSLFLLIPAWVYVGLIPMTWCVYGTAYLLRASEQSMSFANIIVILIFTISALVLFLQDEKKNRNLHIKKPGLAMDCKEIIFTIAVLLLSAILFWTTFRIVDGTLYVGLSVFGDFSPHMGMVRSFSTANNFPTVYSHFAGEDIRYHFMFQFLVGNLEYLGIRVDYAFNLASMLGMFSTVSVLYVLGAKILGKRAGGFLSVLFFIFHSSLSVFTYLSEQSNIREAMNAFFHTSAFLNYSTNEDWGLWNLNVYCNQRHFAFTLGYLLLIVVLLLPHFYEAMARLKNRWNARKTERLEKRNRNKQGSAAGNILKDMLFGIQFFIQESLFAPEGWKIGNPVQTIVLGVLMGSLAFWNGAVTIGALLVLFVLAIVSDHRLDFLIVALLTVALSFLQSGIFINESAVSPSLFYGFIAENRTFFGVMDYLYRMMGALFFVLLAAFVISDGIKRWLLLAFAAPLVFSFHVSLTTDVTVNHKYIMISLMLMGILAAYVILRIWEQRRFLIRLAAVALTVMLTLTGFFDFLVVINQNQSCLTYDTNSKLTKWIQDNSNAQDIFLTSNYSLNEVVLGGAMLFNGWQYFAWSAGYNTALRDELVRQMYEADSVELLRELTEENNIRFIIVDNDNRNSPSYSVREDIIAAAFTAVYTQGEDSWKLTIYDVDKPIAALN